MNRIIPFIAAPLLLLSGCASYNAAPLSTLSQEIIHSTDSQEVFAYAKTFTKQDCKRYLDRDVIREGYQPIQLFIQNNSNRNYSFSLSRITLSCARPEEVAEKVHTSTVGRAAGYGAGALLFWPLIIPAIVDGVKSSEANGSLDNDFFAKSARDQTIFPHSHMNSIVFVPISEYTTSFTITLIDQDSKKPKNIKVFSS